MTPLLNRIATAARQALQRLRGRGPRPAATPAAIDTPADPAVHLATADRAATGDPDDASAPGRAPRPAPRTWPRRAAVAGAATAAAALVLAHPPVHLPAPGELALRTHRFTGQVTAWDDGPRLVLPGVHSVRSVPLRDQTWQAERLARADGPAPAQTVEGASIGLALSVRWAVDGERLRGLRPPALPADIAAELIAPAVHAEVYRLLAQRTVREVFSTRRTEIQAEIEQALRARLAADGVLLRAVTIGQVDLPADYRKGLDGLLAEGLATEKMRYTLELKARRVQETELEAAADKVRRETAAEATAREQVIAARAQEEAMKHILPFKQRLVEQRQLEAEAERQARIRQAEGEAQARRIEAQGEAEARQKLAEAEAFRLARIGQVQAAQMAAEGVLISRHPLLIQKTLADRLGDKVQVIIAPTPAAGGFIGEALVGAVRARAASPDAEPATATEAD